MIIPILVPFRTFTSIRITIGSGLKRVAIGSISKRHQTNLFAQCSETFLENVNFVLVCTILIFNKLQAKSLDMEYTFQRKLFRAVPWVRMM